MIQSYKPELTSVESSRCHDTQMSVRAPTRYSTAQPKRVRLRDKFDIGDENSKKTKTSWRWICRNQIEFAFIRPSRLCYSVASVCRRLSSVCNVKLFYRGIYCG